MSITSHESDMALEDARAQYATQWASLNYSIKNLFYGLYQAEGQLQIQQDEVAASQSNFDIADNKFKAGLIAEDWKRFFFKLASDPAFADQRRANLGGEQSGHVIDLARGTTGDGPMTAVTLFAIAARTKRSLHELASSPGRLPRRMPGTVVAREAPFT